MCVSLVNTVETSRMEPSVVLAKMGTVHYNGRDRRKQMDQCLDTRHDDVKDCFCKQTLLIMNCYRSPEQQHMHKHIIHSTSVQESSEH